MKIYRTSNKIMNNNSNATIIMNTIHIHIIHKIPTHTYT